MLRSKASDRATGKVTVSADILVVRLPFRHAWSLPFVYVCGEDGSADSGLAGFRCPGAKCDIHRRISEAARFDNNEGVSHSLFVRMYRSASGAGQAVGAHKDPFRNSPDG